jgi:hypothetical protein
VSSVDSPLPHQDSLFFSDSSSLFSYNYAWDTFPLLELDLLPAGPQIQQFEFEYRYQDQQGEPQAKLNDFFLPLQLPDMEPVFPGYETSTQLRGSHGMEFGLDQQFQQNPSAEVNNGPWFTLSVDGNPNFQYHSLPAESFQAPVELHSRPENCLPVRTSCLELDMEATSGSGLDIRLDDSGNADYAPMPSSSRDFTSAFFDLTHSSPKPGDLATFTDATCAQPSQVYSTDSFGFDARSQWSHLDHEVNPDFLDLIASGDYFDQCRWDFELNPALDIVQGLPGGGLQNSFMFSN